MTYLKSLIVILSLLIAVSANAQLVDGQVCWDYETQWEENIDGFKIHWEHYEFVNKKN